MGISTFIKRGLLVAWLVFMPLLALAQEESIVSFHLKELASRKIPVMYASCSFKAPLPFHSGSIYRNDKVVLALPLGEQLLYEDKIPVARNNHGGILFTSSNEGRIGTVAVVYLMPNGNLALDDSPGGTMTYLLLTDLIDELSRYSFTYADPGALGQILTVKPQQSCAETIGPKLKRFQEEMHQRRK